MARPPDIPPLPPVDPGGRMADRAEVEDLLLLGCGGVDGALAAVRAELAGEPEGPFDPDLVINAMIARGLTGQSRFWRDRYVETGRRMVSALCGAPPDRAPDVRRLPPQRFEMELTRRFDLRGPTRRLRMPLPAPTPHLDILEITVDADGHDMQIEPGRLEARTPADLRGGITLRARLSFVATPPGPHGLDGPGPTAADRARSEGPIQVTPRISALAADLARAGADPFDQVLAFRDHLMDTLVCGRPPPERLDAAAAPDAVLALGWFDCRLGAALLASLCRAAGLPARLVGGYLLWAAPAEHYWMEAWLPDRGWTPFDLLAWDLSAGGHDPEWRGLYAGALDYRLTTQVFPDVFTGAPGVPLPRLWRRLSRAIPGGTETRLLAAPDGALVYADTIRRL